MSSVVIYLEGGDTEKVEVCEDLKKGLPAFYVEFKTPTVLDMAALGDKIMKNGTTTAVTKAHAQFLSEHITCWNLVKKNGDVIDFRAPMEILKLSPHIFNKLVAIVRKDIPDDIIDVNDQEKELKN